jgi:hypothetical protein
MLMARNDDERRKGSVIHSGAEGRHDLDAVNAQVFSALNDVDERLLITFELLDQLVPRNQTTRFELGSCWHSPDPEISYSADWPCHGLEQTACEIVAEGGIPVTALRSSGKSIFEQWDECATGEVEVFYAFGHRPALDVVPGIPFFCRKVGNEFTNSRECRLQIGNYHLGL